MYTPRTLAGLESALRCVGAHRAYGVIGLISWK